MNADEISEDPREFILVLFSVHLRKICGKGFLLFSTSA